MTFAKHTAAPTTAMTPTAAIASFASVMSAVSISSIVLALLAGCTPLTPNLDSQFGNALGTLKRSQIVDPEASASQDNPAQDGRAAAEATSRYVKSFNAPTPHQGALIGGSGGAR
ncbi:hypothetical protein [Noviherbaspirillum malthae]|uniref:hypothetical protein n=1 Tax=Noviherbaspirillum malthae TaxID=1260987 RepID=UPI00188FD838|nr:hypothetical protein [Noviherbaspirillum malthae]